ncbi:hypothetical protein HanPSC8_Chr05g0193071 [Helianthus annuus]|nr:hypothetical protein HanPSC8_Chr05g0193071 [Helianthus annuus]
MAPLSLSLRSEVNNNTTQANVAMDLRKTRSTTSVHFYSATIWSHDPHPGPFPLRHHR